MNDLHKLNSISRIPPGRELVFEKNWVPAAKDRARLRTACDGVTRRTGAVFEVRETATHFIVRRLQTVTTIKAASPQARAEREAKTWLLPDRLPADSSLWREFRIGRAYCCLRRVARVTGENVPDVATRLGLDHAILGEDPRFGYEQ